MFVRNMNTPQDVGEFTTRGRVSSPGGAGCGRKTYRSSDEQGSVDSLHVCVVVEITIRLRAA